MNAIDANRLHIKWQDHRDFQSWQSAQLMNIIFGAGYVPVPYLPSGYEEYGRRWFQNEARNWGWGDPFPSTEKRPVRGI